MIRIVGWMVVASLVGGRAAVAQTPQAPPPMTQAAPDVGLPTADAPAPTPDRQSLRCADFRRLPGGAWTPRHTLVVRGTTLAPGTSFTAGVSFGGVDPAAWLDRNCAKPAGR